jgi:uncharacterized RDD family membrane protein YckC
MNQKIRVKKNILYKRTIAFSIDLLIYLPLIIIIQFGIEFFFGKGVLINLIGLGFMSLFFCKDSINGQSFGKKYVNIRVVDHSKLIIANPLKCLLRNLLIMFWFVDIFLLSSSKRRLGDIITNCEVIEWPQQSSSNIHLNRMWLTIFAIVISYAISLSLFLLIYYNCLSFQLLLM